MCLPPLNPAPFRLVVNDELVTVGLQATKPLHAGAAKNLDMLRLTPYNLRVRMLRYPVYSNLMHSPHKPHQGNKLATVRQPPAAIRL